MKFFDAFAGIGGFRLGMERAGHQCVGGSEIDKYARAIYERRFGKEDTHLGDIRAIDAAKLPDFDVLCGGFPCQAFSVAGRRGGFSDTRGTLFFEIARIAKAKAPHTMFLENVKGLLSHDRGWTFWTILRTLDELGYDTSWQVLNSVARVPQNRERVFIVARSRTRRFREVFPFTSSDLRHPCTHEATQGEGERVLDDGGQVAGTVRPGARSACNSTIIDTTADHGDTTGTIDANYYKGGPRTLVELTEGVGDAHRIYDSEGVAKTLKGLGGGQGAKTGLYLIRKNMKGKESKLKEGKYMECGERASTIMSKADYNPKVVYKQGFGADSNMKESDIVPPLKASDCKYGDTTPFIVQGNQRKEYLEKDETGAIQSSMTGNQVSRVLTPESRIRRLTPLECERLQGFPDNWTSEGIMNGKLVKISDTQRYKVCGNSVTVDIIHEIAKRL